MSLNTMHVAMVVLATIIVSTVRCDFIHAAHHAPSAQNETDSPVRIGSTTKRSGKPPMILYDFDVEFINRRAEPVWLVMRYWGDHPLNKSNVFTNLGPQKQPFEATQYLSNPRSKGQTVIVHYLSDNGFKAIRLPKGGKVKFDKYSFEAWKEVSHFEIWEAGSLLVNGKTPLEKWLPFTTISAVDVHVVEESGYDNMISLEWDESINNYRKDFPKGRVRFVTVQALRKWMIPLKIKNAI